MQAHGTGALNIDDCRVAAPARVPKFYHKGDSAENCYGDGPHGSARTGELDMSTGRWPANLIHDGSDEVLTLFPDSKGQLADASTNADARKTQNTYGAMRRGRGDEASADSDNTGAVGFKMKPGARWEDAGSAARFFYCAKARRAEPLAPEVRCLLDVGLGYQGKGRGIAYPKKRRNVLATRDQAHIGGG